MKLRSGAMTNERTLLGYYDPFCIYGTHIRRTDFQMVYIQLLSKKSLIIQSDCIISAIWINAFYTIYRGNKFK